ncbi:Hypothetical predicted protein [Cloeon dipterum]|uniref:Microtubule-associated protein futsch n=1 Tax=Cloeon dipterum TaxID=197152 RepID=A0A8S1C5W9_9INSE|nr:Hypothetical predicted protein [Cloeon dipterum]
MEEASASSTAPPAAPGPEVAPPGPPPAPSPLSGGYLLIILGEPHCEEHKDIILQRLAKGFLSWDSDVCHVDLEKELLHLAAQKPDGEESKNGERLIQFASESLVTEVLIQPQTTTLIQCARNLLSSFTRHRHIIHAGYTFAGNGSWALQDGTFSLLDFLDALREPEPQRVIRAYENNVSIDIQCSAEGEWSTAKITKEPGTKGCMVRVNPDDKMTAGSPGITQFVEYISNFLVPARIEELLEPSDVVGNIRFSHPTLYVFPGGQGDAALFGINGFNMLVDGGYSRKSCFWDFTRHLDRLDAVMVTRINNSNVGGIASVLKRKTLGYVYPQIGHFFCNMQERRSLPSPDGDKDRDPLLIDLLDEGHSLIANLRLLELKPHACYRDSVIEPINLYHKVGHGKLDMYVLSPAKDSKDVREFLAKWSTNDQKLFTSKTSKLDSQFPLYNMTSICALLVWQPANPTDTITRILFPGSTPQHKIFEGLEKIKHLEFLKFPTCTAKSMALSAAPKPKSKLFDKPAIETKVKKITPAIEKSIPIEPKSKLIEAEKNNKNNLSSQRVERKSTSKQEDKKDSPPTPKKAVEAKPKIEKVKRSRSPTIPPAKSDKEANNRKVLESKIEKSKTSTVKSAPKREPPKETKAVSEKKFVSLKKPKVAPPAKPSPPVSPKKQLKPKSSPKKVLKREVKSTTKKVEKVIKAKAPPALADDKPGESKVETEEPKPAHVEIEAVDDVLTATIVKEAEAAEEQSVEAADGEAPSALQSQAEDVTEEDILSDKQGDADEKVSETEGDIDTQVDEEMVTDDGENKHIRDEEESEKERAKKDNAEAEGVDAQIEEQEEEKQLEADIPEVTDAGVEVTTEIVLTETPEKEIEIKEGQGEQDQEVLDAKEKPVIVEKREDISEDKHPEIIKEKEAEEEVKDTADETVAPVQSDENQIEVKDVTPELCGVVDVIAATVADEQTVEEKEGKDISEETKQKIEGEVKEIITSAQSKVAEEDATKETRETESVAVEVDAADTKIDVSSEKQKEDSPQEDKKDIKMEEGTNTKSQPDEKLSAMETSATTAPSMPEDEKIDDKIILDGIVEEKVEEKLVVAEVKEAAAPTIEPLKAIQLEQTHLQHHRDLVKTPDEVADLPMHEEVDGVLFDSSDDKKNDEDKIEQSPESLANKAAAKIDESVPQENVNTIEVAAEGTEVIESTPEQNEEQTKEIIGIKEMQKSAIDEKEVDTTLESKHDEKPTEAGSSLQKDMDEDVKEEVDAVPIGQYDEVEEAVGQEIKNVEDEKKDEEKKTPSPIQETKIDQKNDDAVDSATAQNGLELSDFEKVIDEEYGIKTQMKPAAEELSIKAEAVVEVQSLSISTKCPDKEALDTEEKDKESPKGDLELAEVETGSDGQLNDLSREKDEFVIDIDEKGSEAVGRRLSQTSPKQDLKLLVEETEEAIKDEPRSVVQKPDLKLEKADSKEPSRPASEELAKAESKEPSRPESADEAKDGSKEPSRPAPTELPKAESKEPSRPESADIAKDGSKRPSRPALYRATKAESKEPSRPESADKRRMVQKPPGLPLQSYRKLNQRASRPESADMKDGSKESSRLPLQSYRKLNQKSHLDPNLQISEGWFKRALPACLCRAIESRIKRAFSA